MKILLLDKIQDELLGRFLSENVFYRPDLLQKNPKMLERVLISSEIDAVISCSPLPATLLHDWAAARRRPAYWVRLTIGGESGSCAQAEDVAANAHEPILLLVQDTEEARAYNSAFEILERHFSCGASSRAVRKQVIRAVAPRGQHNDPVLMVGAGLVNLITAYALQREGYALHIVDGGPDPRDDAPWTAYGCSRGGDDARMFTLSEMDNYNDKEVSCGMNSLFGRKVSDLGWSVHWNGTLSSGEQNWIREFESIPVWLAKRYNDDIFVFNRESRPLWESWIERDPDLFEASLLRDGILRLYSDPDQYLGAVQRQNRIGATRKILSAETVAAEHPALAAAVQGGHIAGGVFVVGFTVNAHKFIHQLIARLEQGGAHFEWNQRAQSILFDALGTVKGVRTSSRVLEAPHYVISPGAYGDPLLAGTRSQGKIHGVLGAWLRLPNVEPQLGHSLKLARRGHITEDSNITVATDPANQPIMILGSGYGHTGVDPRNVDGALLNEIYDGLVDTAETYFPAAYDTALAAGNLQASLKYCVRPWTATGLGVFEMLPTQRGGTCIITGGHNTGGFTQAPAVGQAVLAAIGGREHAMHAAYHPDRAPTFLGSSSHATATPPRMEYAEVS